MSFADTEGFILNLVCISQQQWQYGSRSSSPPPDVKSTRERLNVERVERNDGNIRTGLTAPCLYHSSPFLSLDIRRLENALALLASARISASFLLLSNSAKLLNELAVCFFHSRSLVSYISFSYSYFSFFLPFFTRLILVLTSSSTATVMAGWSPN